MPWRRAVRASARWNGSAPMNAAASASRVAGRGFGCGADPVRNVGVPELVQEARPGGPARCHRVACTWGFSVGAHGQRTVVLHGKMQGHPGSGKLHHSRGRSPGASYTAVSQCCSIPRASKYLISKRSDRDVLPRFAVRLSVHGRFHHCSSRSSPDRRFPFREMTAPSRPARG